MLNKVMVQGRFVNDVVSKVLNDEVLMVVFSLACERDYKNPETGKRDVDFIDVVAKGTIAEFVQRNFKKGDTVIVTGRFKGREYEDSKKNKRYGIEISCEQIYRG